MRVLPGCYRDNPFYRYPVSAWEAHLKLLLLAAPGGGKGTQGERLAELYGVRHISSGDVLRAEVAAGTPAGREIAGYQSRGILFEMDGDRDPDVLTAAIKAALDSR
jgi:dephospho-CoA kinase